MQTLVISSICAVILIICCCLPISRLAAVLIFAAPLTTLSVLRVGEKDILFLHLLFLLLLVRYLFYGISRRRAQIVMPKTMSWFLVWCLLTIPLAALPLNRGIIVSSIDGQYAAVAPSFQQWTQYGYLFIAFCVCLIIASLLADGTLRKETLVKALCAGYLFELALIAAQTVLPDTFVLMTYRNAVHVIYANFGSRLSGSFNEPSMWACYTTPFFCLSVLETLKKPRPLYILSIVLYVFCFLQNQSSSALAGIGAFALILAIGFFFRDKFVLHRKRIFGTLLGLISLALAAYLLRDRIQDVVDGLNSKLNLENVSGINRSYAFFFQLNVFLQRFLTGVGWGTVRSYDLLSTLLAEVGIVGFLLYFLPTCGGAVRLIRLSYRNHPLYKASRGAAESAGGRKIKEALDLSDREIDRYTGYFVLIYNSILFVSVPEMYFYTIWIVYALEFYRLWRAGELRAVVAAFRRKMIKRTTSVPADTFLNEPPRS